MSLKKNLKSKSQAQVSIEYLVLFILLAFFCLLSFSTFFPKVRNSCEAYFNQTRDRILGSN